MADSIKNAIGTELAKSGLAFRILPCDPDKADTEVFCEHYGHSPDCSANTILVKAKTGEARFVACVLLASSRLDVNRVVRKRLGARRVSFASGEETRTMTSMEIGGVTPLALPEGLPLWVDSRVLAVEYVILGGGDRASKIQISPEIFRLTPNTSIIDRLAKTP